MSAIDRQIRRRDFLKAASYGATALALTACVPATSPSAAPPSGSPATGGTPAPSTPAAAKTVRFAMTGKVTSADTADPHFNTTTHDGRLNSACYEQLAQFDESLQAVPQLAESWESNAAATEWTFKMRSGVTFHDGDALTARDVVYSYKRILDPAVASPGAGNLAAVDPDGITAVDDMTVRFRLTSANVDFPLSTVFRQAYIIRDGSSGDDLKTTANGTGPFMLDTFTPGETPTVFLKNPAYWAAGLPKVDTIELTAIPEGPSRVAALKRGQVDIIEEPPSTDYDSLGSGAETTIVTQVKGNMELIAMTIDTPPFDNPKLRQAMKYVALDLRHDRRIRPVLERLVVGRGRFLDDVDLVSLQGGDT